MTYTETTINALVGIAYSYAVEMNEAAIHADHDELEQLARQITDSLKAKLRAVLEEHQAAAPTTRAALQDDEQEEALRCTAWLEHIAAGGEVVEIDGLAGTSAAGLRRLSVMVDELRELLQDAKRAMVAHLLQERDALAAAQQRPVEANNPRTALAIRFLVAAGHVTQEKADNAFRLACEAVKREANRQYTPQK